MESQLTEWELPECTHLKVFSRDNLLILFRFFFSANVILISQTHHNQSVDDFCLYRSKASFSTARLTTGTYPYNCFIFRNRSISSSIRVIFMNNSWISTF